MAELQHPFQIIKDKLGHIPIDMNADWYRQICDVLEKLPDGDSDYYTHVYYKAKSISGDDPTPLTESPYEMVRKTILSKQPPYMADDDYEFLCDVMRAIPEELDPEEKSLAIHYGSYSGALVGSIIGFVALADNGRGLGSRVGLQAALKKCAGVTRSEHRSMTLEHIKGIGYGAVSGFTSGAAVGGQRGGIVGGIGMVGGAAAGGIIGAASITNQVVMTGLRAIGARLFG